MATAQISPGNPPPSDARRCPRLPYRYWTLKISAFSSDATASDAVSVRRARVLPAASFRFHLAMDTLAVRLTLPPVGCVEDFHLQVGAPCRAHQKKPPVSRRLASHFAGLFLYAMSDQSGSNRLSPVISTGFSIPRIPRMVGATSARRPSRTLKFPGPT